MRWASSTVSFQSPARRPIRGDVHMICTGRGTPKADAVRKLIKGGCIKMQTRGEGAKDLKIVQTSYVHGP